MFIFVYYWVLSLQKNIKNNYDLTAKLIAGCTVFFALIAAFPKVNFLPDFTIYEEITKPIVFVGLLTAILLIKPYALSFNKSDGEKSFSLIGFLIDSFIISVIFIFAGTFLYEIILEKPELFPEWIHVNEDPMERVFDGQPLWVIIVAIVTCITMLILNVRIWGWPLAIVAIVAVTYAVSAAIFTLNGWSDNNVFMNYRLGALDPLTEIRKFVIIGDAHALLGRFPSILVRIVLPFVILGSVFAATGGGASLIRLAFNLTRKMRGGPAHAAILSSSLFGTMTGGPVVNVLSTGALTIPMMLRRKFTPVFAGGVEAAASSGGQIVPPVMGIAAFFLANFTGVNYSYVILAAIIPALLYYFTLFITVIFESRKLGIEPIGEVTQEMLMTRQDWLNLIIIFVPILIIIFVLASGIFSVTGAGMLALLSLLPLSFIDPNVRKKPSILLNAFGSGSLNASRILLLFMAVGLVDSSLSATGFPTSFGNLMLTAGDTFRDISLFGFSFSLGNYMFLFVVLVITMVSAILLGMGMPTLPAYANVAIVTGGALTSLGLSFFTSHMFVFYFAVASAITPPVAIAAFAASSITKADPIKTGLTAVRVGITMFIVPFIFCFYPELLLIEDAFISDILTRDYIETRPNGFELSIFLSILPRVILAIYLVSSALTAFDLKPLAYWEIFLRLFLAILILFSSIYIYLPAAIFAILIIVLHFRTNK